MNKDNSFQAALARNQGAERIMPAALNGGEKPVGRSLRTSILPKDGSSMLPLEYMFDVPVEMVFEVGRIEITIKQLLEMDKGAYLELRNVPVDVIDIRINDKVLARGETIALHQRYGIRFNELEEFNSVEDLENGGQ
ncbi:MAG TPA: FliM/FliN family flagellar motor switch protein [Candidatus Acidoferrum sp.]|nr:FliM/FliN family flagellar motor switch protein [Candidatus Acidoferrum sp.]